MVDCEAGWDYNVTEGLRNNIVTEVKLQLRIHLALLITVLASFTVLALALCGKVDFVVVCVHCMCALLKTRPVATSTEA